MNRVRNLVGVPFREHEAISLAWSQFKRSLGGRTPSRAQVMKYAVHLDEMFADVMKYIDR